MPTFQLLQGQDEGTGSQRWGDGMDSRDKHSHTTEENMPTCPASSGWLHRDGNFSRGIWPGVAGGGVARGKVFICAQKQLCMLPVLVIL